MSRAAFLRGLDPRLKMAASLVLGVLLWRVPPLAALGAALVLGWCAVPLFRGEPGNNHLRAVVLFVLLWVMVKGAVDLIAGAPPEATALACAVLAARLAGLILLGFVLSLSTSPHAMGMALSWFLRPLGRERAWRTALALALMVHFLPMGTRVVAGVRQAASLRCPPLPLSRRLVLVPLAVLRTMGGRAWDQTVAVASRSMDRAEAWAPRFAWSRRDTLTACAFSLLFLVSFIS